MVMPLLIAGISKNFSRKSNYAQIFCFSNLYLFPIPRLWVVGRCSLKKWMTLGLGHCQPYHLGASTLARSWQVAPMFSFFWWVFDGVSNHHKIMLGISKSDGNIYIYIQIYIYIYIYSNYLHIQYIYIYSIYIQYIYKYIIFLYYIYIYRYVHYI